VSIPGARSAALAKRLSAHESRNVTFLCDDFPIFWKAASGATVIDADDNRYVDCTAAFGVANVGHCNAHVARAVREQANRLMHGMGDVHPTEIKVQLLERLSEILPPGLSKTFLATTGSEAVEAALKTAILATGKARFATYRGAYHGLSFGALSVGGIEQFRKPFAGALGAQPVMLEYPRAGLNDVDHAIMSARKTLRASNDIAALLIEPIQGRAGCVVPPPGYLAALRALCDDLGILMIADEIFTGFGRTGAWFAVAHDAIVPDILCIGKAMGSGIPISAAIGTAKVMDAWPSSTGEALHTSTFLGNPLGCAAALATIDEMERHDLPSRAAALGSQLRSRVEALRAHDAVVDVRGRGLLWGIEFRDPATAFAVIKRALREGVILLQSGVWGETITLSPPLVIEPQQLERAVAVLTSAIEAEERVGR